MLLRRATIFLRTAIISGVLSSMSVAFIPLRRLVKSSVSECLLIIIASVFWGGLLLEQIFLWRAHELRGIMQEKGVRLKRLAKARPGITTFRSNREATLADAGVILFAMLMLITSVVNMDANWSIPICLALFLASFHLHCIFNGKTYRYVKVIHRKKRGKR